MRILKWIGFVSITAILFGCSAPGSPNTGDGHITATRPAPAPAHASTADQALLAFDPYRPFANWEYSVKKDPMTDKMTSTATLSSEETVELDSPYEGKQSATLVLRHGPRDASDVFMYLQRGQIQCDGFSDFGCPLRIRLDDADPELVNGSPPDDNDEKFVFLPNPESLIHRIASAKKLRIEVTIFQQGTRVFTFNVGGLDIQKLNLSSPPKQGIQHHK